MEFKITTVEKLYADMAFVADTRVNADVIDGDPLVPTVSIDIRHGELKKPDEWFKRRFLKTYNKWLKWNRGRDEAEAERQSIVGRVIDP